VDLTASIVLHRVVAQLALERALKMANVAVLVEVNEVSAEPNLRASFSQDVADLWQIRLSQFWIAHLISIAL
jgi:hypothetical protein